MTNSQIQDNNQGALARLSDISLKLVTANVVVTLLGIIVTSGGQ